MDGGAIFLEPPGFVHRDGFSQVRRQAAQIVGGEFGPVPIGSLNGRANLSGQARRLVAVDFHHLTHESAVATKSREKCLRIEHRRTMKKKTARNPSKQRMADGLIR